MLKYMTLIILILVIMFFMYIGKTDVLYVKSDVDNIEYMVRNLNDKKTAANMLANIKQNIFRLVQHLSRSSYPEYKEYIKNLAMRIKNVDIKESSPYSQYTSYSVNKGEQLVFCLRSKVTNDLHEMNIIMFVAIHELAHIACPEIGHTNLFKKIFIFLLKVANEVGIYKYVNYALTPLEYCGLHINETPL